MPQVSRFRDLGFHRHVNVGILFDASTKFPWFLIPVEEQKILLLVQDKRAVLSRSLSWPTYVIFLPSADTVMCAV